MDWFYPAWKAGRAKWNEMKRSGFVAVASHKLKKG